MQEKIIILDFGSQTTQLIHRERASRKDNADYGRIIVWKFVVRHNLAISIQFANATGYGAQFMSYTNGGKVEPAGTREYGRAHLSTFDQENPK